MVAASICFIDHEYFIYASAVLVAGTHLCCCVFVASYTESCTRLPMFLIVVTARLHIIEYAYPQRWRRGCHVAYCTCAGLRNHGKRIMYTEYLEYRGVWMIRTGGVSSYCVIWGVTIVIPRIGAAYSTHHRSVFVFSLLLSVLLLALVLQLTTATIQRIVPCSPIRFLCLNSITLLHFCSHSSLYNHFKVFSQKPCHSKMITNAAQNISVFQNLLNSQTLSKSLNGIVWRADPVRWRRWTQNLSESFLCGRIGVIRGGSRRTVVIVFVLENLNDSRWITPNCRDGFCVGELEWFTTNHAEFGWLFLILENLSGGGVSYTEYLELFLHFREFEWLIVKLFRSNVLLRSSREKCVNVIDTIEISRIENW